MRLFIILFATLLALSGVSSPPAVAQSGGLSVEPFVATATMRSVTLSPSGRYLAYIHDGADEDTLFVADLESDTATPIQTARHSVGGRLMWVRFKTDDRVLIGVSQSRDIEGREITGSRVNFTESFEFTRWRVFAANRSGGVGVEMFAEQQRQLAYGIGSTFLVDTLPNDPDAVLLTATDNSGVGVWRADVNTGRAERLVNGSFDTIDYVTDGAGNAVIRIDSLPNDSGWRFLRRAPGERGWTNYRDVRRAAGATNSPDFQALGPGPGAGQVYVLARPETQDLLSLHLFDTATGELGPALQQGNGVDVAVPWVNPSTRQVLANCEYGPYMRCTSPDPTVERHLRAVESFLGPHHTVTLYDISDDASVWLLYVEAPQEPGAYYLYDRNRANVSAVAQVFPEVPLAALSPVTVVNYTARDGQPLWAYVTAREGSQGPRPMVVMPHGGPEVRDYYGYDAFAQFLAAQGYVVVQPNFRGSDGFGRAFADAGRGQWGLRMQDDVSDAVRHMIENGVADPQRVCIVGASYGGYAALAGVTLTPELYACAVSISGVSDLIESLRDERMENGRASRSYNYWIRSIGDPRQNRDALIATSPARLADRVRAPVLLIHGTEDDIVTYRQSELMQRALEGVSRPTRLVRLEGADHFWDNWTHEQRVTMYTETAAFLAQHLGPAN